MIIIPSLGSDKQDLLLTSRRRTAKTDNRAVGPSSRSPGPLGQRTIGRRPTIHRV